MIIFTIIGVVAVAWWLLGVLMIAFAPAIYVSKDAPLSAKLGALWAGAWVYPKLYFMAGYLPAMIIAPEDPDEDESLRIREFQQSMCQCPRCRQRRKDEA